MHRLRIGLLAAFLLAAATAAFAGHLAGPAPERAPEAVSPSAAPDLTATAEIRRSFMTPGTVTVAVTNHGDAPVQILGVELLSDSFAPLGLQTADATVPPSVNPRDLLIDLGAASCPDGIDSTTAPASVRLLAATEDGAAHEVTADLPHPNGTLDRLLREACTAEAVAKAVDLSLGDLHEAADGTLEGVLTAEPLAGADLAVTDVRGSVLFTVEATEGLPETGASVPLRFDAFRCEGHAVGDAKQPFAFTVWIAVDGAEPVAGPIEVPEAQREALWAMLDVRCGRG
ncbi:hypothetical protein [Glycomyces paridis]|uniref:DUF4232 domain-containing protein n=1 Tax=Glycomyces paridis TaxID=2126555 RepID=A0A4V6T684_9ACTN|nr:hypothetical protein [Glycomyces paridis]THV24306.1 hypothetical protein E9998_22040 [Glycomyces paridis]